MKCQKCGNNNATFHYRANINGQKTEQHLCAECAEKAGYTEERIFGADMFDSMFSNFFDGFFTPFGRSFFPEFGRIMMPVITIPQIEYVVKNDDGQSREKVPTATDEEMKRRREINIIREQMNAAVKEENFEKAAELRDRIRKLEKND